MFVKNILPYESATRDNSPHTVIIHRLNLGKFKSSVRYIIINWDGSDHEGTPLVSNR